MKIIFLRGLPGTGKSEISKRISATILDSKIICVDNYKRARKKDDVSWSKARNHAYEDVIKTLEKLKYQNAKWVIVEEIIYSKNFYNKLNDFVTQNKIQSYWFRFNRPLKILLENESSRNREITNSLENLVELKRSIDSIKIPGEIIINNKSLEYSVNKVLQKIK